MKSMKKILAVVSVIAVFTATSMSALAEYNPDKVIDPTNPIMTLSADAQAAITVNGTPLTDADTYESDGFTMVPVRAIAEALGITVEWNGEAQRVELSKAPLYVTFTLDEDAYTFARMAPQPLGKAAELHGDKTYVPLECFSEVIQADVTVEGGVIAISYGEEAEKVRGNAVVKSVSDEEILVTDEEMGDVRLANHDELVIRDAQGAELAFADLKEGMNLKVEYSEQMGYSMPPYNAPKSITVVDEADENAEAEKALGYVEITAVNEESITVNDTVRGEVVLHVSDELVITGEEGNAISAADLKEGQFAEVEYSPAMTASLPPQNTPVSIKLIAQLPEQETNPDVLESLSVEGIVKSVDEAGRVLTECTGDYEGDVLLIVSDETKITGPKGEEADAALLIEGARIKAEISPAMTRSIPPQSAAHSIQILKVAR